MKHLILAGGIFFFCCVTGKSQDMAVEQFVHYPGGVEQFYDYIKTNLHYPATALADSISGNVVVDFVVGRDGTVVSGSVTIVESLSPECDQEAIRLIENSPAWIPARSQGETVEQHVTFPISFNLQ